MASPLPLNFRKIFAVPTRQRTRTDSPRWPASSRMRAMRCAGCQTLVCSPLQRLRQRICEPAAAKAAQAGGHVMLFSPQCTSFDRRDLLCGGGAAMFSAIVVALIGDTKPVRAQTFSGSVPEVDRLAVRVVVDSYQFAVAPSRKVPNVD